MKHVHPRLSSGSKSAAAEFGVEIIVCEMSKDLMGIRREKIIDYLNISIAGVASFLQKAGRSKATLLNIGNQKGGESRQVDKSSITLRPCRRCLLILLFFFPDRLSFFEKCLNTLFCIIGRAQSSERLVHVCELLRIVHVFGIVEGAFGDLNRYGAFFRQLLSPLAGLCFQFILRHYFVNQAQGEGFGS
jgi:hypothetical protein